MFMLLGFLIFLAICLNSIAITLVYYSSIVIKPMSIADIGSSIVSLVTAFAALITAMAAWVGVSTWNKSIEYPELLKLISRSKTLIGDIQSLTADIHMAANRNENENADNELTSQNYFNQYTSLANLLRLEFKKLDHLLNIPSHDISQEWKNTQWNNISWETKGWEIENAIPFVDNVMDHQANKLSGEDRLRIVASATTPIMDAVNELFKDLSDLHASRASLITKLV
jgi:hypothetical protein